MKGKVRVAMATIIIIIVLVGLIYFAMQTKNKNNNLNVMSANDISIEINADNGDEKIDWSKYQTENITLKESITISKGGKYSLNGCIENGAITIDTNDNVELILDNVSIKNSQGPAIYIKSAENVIITLMENSNNYLEDSSIYSGYDEDVNGVIYTKDDITFRGTGTLEILSNYQDAIVGKDDLKIVDGNYVITSKDDGIRGKDSVYILNGSFIINSGGDALKSTNDTDSEKGFILIENGTFNITSTLDGIQAKTQMLIKNGTFNIKTGGGSANSSSSLQNTSAIWGRWSNNSSNQVETESAKGLKSTDNLVIENGTFNFDTSDDSIHSNNYIGIKDGTFNISSGDDGIHADTEIIIDGGNINILKSYEGIEAAKITINNGYIDLISLDDGINVAGGNDLSGMNRPGQNNFSQNTNNILTINGGSVKVNASGDGIDVNGNGYMYGGTVIVDGPSDNGNGFLDYDGEFIINGGEFIGIGSSGMLQGASSNSTQNNVLITFNNNYASGKKVQIIDSSNNIIIEHQAEKNFSAMLISSSKLQKNSTYTIMVDGEKYDNFTVNSISNKVGNSANMMMNNNGMQKGNNRKNF